MFMVNMRTGTKKLNVGMISGRIGSTMKDNSNSSHSHNSRQAQQVNLVYAWYNKHAEMRA